jgi:hypothetical protein
MNEIEKRCQEIDEGKIDFNKSLGLDSLKVG